MSRSAPEVAQDKTAYLAQRLGEHVPKGARLAMCLDPDAEAAIPHIVDHLGRAFAIVTYAGDDLPFRAALRDAEREAGPKEPVLVRVTWPRFARIGAPMDLSSIADVVARVEGPIVNLRTDAVIAHYSVPAVWPEELHAHSVRVGRDLKGFIEGFERLREVLGRDRVLKAVNIRQAILLGAYPELEVRDLELTRAWPEEVVARFVGMAALHRMIPEDAGILLDVLATMAGVADAPVVKAWSALPLTDAMRLAAFGEFLDARGVQNVGAVMAGKGVFQGFVSDAAPSIAKVAEHLRAHRDELDAVRDAVDESAPLEVADAVCSLLREDLPEGPLAAADDAPHCLALALVTGWLDRTLASAAVPVLPMPPVPWWAEGQLDTWDTPDTSASAGARAAALFRMVRRIARVQARIHAAEPTAAGADPLAAAVDAYAGSEDCRLELLLALARKDADVIADRDLLARLYRFLDSLEDEVAAYLDRADRDVADLLDRDPRSWLEHDRSTTRALAREARKLGVEGRLFVWLFDGMRWDTWTDVVRPVLAEAFAIESEAPAFAVVPTYTRLARTSIFAGRHPGQGWKGLRGGFCTSESELAAVNFGLRGDAATKQLLFQVAADTAEGKRAIHEAGLRRFNCLVFNISDDNIHDFTGDLREVNDAIRNKVKKDVVPEMRRAVEAGDRVVLLADHGFVQLRRAQRIEVASRSHEPGRSEVHRRYVVGRNDPPGVVMPIAEGRNDETTCAIGRSWYDRDGRNDFERYAHGGVSLSEMVVPVAVLTRAVEADDVRLDVEMPDRLEGLEDGDLVLVVKVRNRGGRSVSLRLTVANLPVETFDCSRGREVERTSTLRASRDLKVVGVRLEARTRDGRYAPVPRGTRQIAVRVRERDDKIEFSRALDVLDEL